MSLCNTKDSLTIHLAFLTTYTFSKCNCRAKILAKVASAKILAKVGGGCPSPPHLTFYKKINGFFILENVPFCVEDHEDEEKYKF